MHISRPNLALFDHLLILNAELVDHVVVTAGQEGSIFFDNVETPGFTIVMTYVHQLFIGSINIDGLDFTIVVSDENLFVKDVEGRGEVIGLKRDLSQVLKLSLIDIEDREHIILSS